MPLVSIIIPAYNAAPWLGETLASVVAQTVADWECLVIDDGSTDNTAAIAEGCGDSRIVVQRPLQGGVSAARNAGLEAAAGACIAFLDADDLWHPQALEWLLAPLRQNPEWDFAWADSLRFEDGTGRILPLPATRLQYTGTAWLDMLVDNFMPFGAICLRTGLAKGQRFDASLRISEDRDWLLRVLKGRQAVHVPRVVHYYRQRTGSAMRDAGRFLEDEARVMRAHLADADVPPRVRRRALSALDFHAAVLLAKTPGGVPGAVVRYCRAVARDPLYLENYLRPLRKLWFRLRPPSYLRPESFPG